MCKDIGLTLLEAEARAGVSPREAPGEDPGSSDCIVLEHCLGWLQVLGNCGAGPAHAVACREKGSDRSS